MINVQFELLTVNGHTGRMPELGTKGSACWDLATPVDIHLLPKSLIKVPLHIAVDMPEGFCLKLYPRSSVLPTHGLIVPVSVIDADYHGDIHFVAYNPFDAGVIRAGTRLLQAKLELVHDIQWIQAEGIYNESRGGFGSTGL